MAADREDLREAAFLFGVWLMGTRQNQACGPHHQQILDLIRGAGPKGITAREICTALGIGVNSVRNSLMALDPVYEESERCAAGRNGALSGRATRYFWCGKEGACGTECR